MLSLDVEIAVLTNVELDHHATFGSLAELREAFRAFLARARDGVVVWDRPELLELRCATRSQVVRYDAPDRCLRAGGSTLRLARARGDAGGAGRAQRAQRRRRARGRALAGRRRGARGRGAGGFRGAGAALSAAGRDRARGASSTTTTPTTRPRSRRRSRRRARSGTGAWWRSSSRTCTRARALLAREFGARAGARRRGGRARRLSGARARRGPSGRERPAGRRGGRRRGARAGRCTGCRRFADAERGAARACCDAGDVCVVMGAGDVDALGRALVERRRCEVERTRRRPCRRSCSATSRSRG